MLNIIKSIFNINRVAPDKLDVIFDAIADPILIYNAEALVAKANKAAVDFLQFDPAGMHNNELIEKTGFSLVSNEPAAVNLILTKVLKGEMIKDSIYQFNHIYGQQRFYACSAAPICNHKSIAGAILIWHDITTSKARENQLKISVKNLKNKVSVINEKQKLADKQIKNDRAEIDLKDSQIMVTNKLLEIIFSNTHFLIAYLDLGFNFIQVNEAYARAFNRTPDFFYGKNHFDLFPHEKNRAVFERVVKTGLSHITYGEPFFHSGKPKPGLNYWDWSLQPVINNHAVEGIILVMIDVTRRKNAEEDLFNAKRLSDIGTLAAIVAHELRNPLSVIQAAVYNIKRKSGNTGIDKHLENIKAKVDESEQIISNLLSYSSFKAPKLTEIVIYSFLNELINDIQGKKPNENITFKRRYDKLKNLKVNIDPFQMREVINNIMNNACQSLPPAGGHINIMGKVSNNNQWILYITDNGEGIDKEDLEKIFNPFFTNKSRGTGLGLTISNELIKLHNGNIEIKSRKQQGTTVKITLPLKLTE